MNPLELTFDLTISLTLIASLVAGLVAWLRSRLGGMDARAQLLADRQDRHENRIVTIEQAVQSLPGRDDMHALQIAMSEMRGDLREMRASMDGNKAIMARLEAIVTRQDEYLRGK